MKPAFVGMYVGTQTVQGSADASEIEALRAENERLKEQLARTRDVEFLGDVVPADLLSELAASRKLTARSAKTTTKPMTGDGGGLWLQVTPGGRSWLFRFNGREMGLGSLKDVPLAEARGRAFICRRLVRAGVDPIERRNELAAATAPSPKKRTTFKHAAQRYFDSKKAGWRSDKHSIQFPNTMRDYVHPTIGEWPVGDVDTDALLKILEQEVRGPDGKVIGTLWRTKPETAARVRARIEQVLDWATALKMRQGENPARWRGHLDAILPARSKVRAVKHHAALPFADMFEFWELLKTRTSVSAEALRFTILTAARTGEVIGARWREVDLGAKTWTVPAERMKAHRQHRVALSDAAVEVLERMKPLKKADDDFIFPGAKPGEPLSQMAMTMLLRKMGRGDLTTHGFRSTFRDWAAECTNFPGDMVEMALAHTISNRVEAAYRRLDQLDRRRRLMGDWAAHIKTKPVPKADNVTHIGAAR